MRSRGATECHIIDNHKVIAGFHIEILWLLKLLVKNIRI